MVEKMPKQAIRLCPLSEMNAAMKRPLITDEKATIKTAASFQQLAAVCGQGDFIKEGCSPSFVPVMNGFNPVQNFVFQDIGIVVYIGFIFINIIDLIQKRQQAKRNYDNG